MDHLTVASVPNLLMIKPYDRGSVERASQYFVALRIEMKRNKFSLVTL